MLHTKTVNSAAFDPTLKEVLVILEGAGGIFFLRSYGKYYINVRALSTNQVQRVAELLIENRSPGVGGSRVHDETNILIDMSMTNATVMDRFQPLMSVLSKLERYSAATCSFQRIRGPGNYRRLLAISSLSSIALKRQPSNLPS